MKKTELVNLIKECIKETSIVKEVRDDEKISKINELINQIGVLEKSCKDKSVKELFTSAKKSLKSARSKFM